MTATSRVSSSKSASPADQVEKKDEELLISHSHVFLTHLNARDFEHLLTLPSSLSPFSIAPDFFAEVHISTYTTCYTSWESYVDAFEHAARHTREVGVENVLREASVTFDRPGKKGGNLKADVWLVVDEVDSLGGLKTVARSRVGWSRRGGEGEWALRSHVVLRGLE